MKTFIKIILVALCLCVLLAFAVNAIPSYIVPMTEGENILPNNVHNPIVDRIEDNGIVVWDEQANTSVEEMFALQNSIFG